MANDKLKLYQAVLDRGLADSLPQDKREKFDMLVERGLIVKPVDMSSPQETTGFETVKPSPLPEGPGTVAMSSDILGGFVGNMIPSLVGIAEGIGTAASHPLQTIDALTTHPKGSPLEALGVNKNPYLRAVTAPLSVGANMAVGLFDSYRPKNLVNTLTYNPGQVVVDLLPLSPKGAGALSRGVKSAIPTTHKALTRAAESLPQFKKFKTPAGKTLAENISDVHTPGSLLKRAKQFDDPIIADLIDDKGLLKVHAKQSTPGYVKEDLLNIANRNKGLAGQAKDSIQKALGVKKEHANIVLDAVEQARKGVSKNYEQFKDVKIKADKTLQDFIQNRPAGKAAWKQADDFIRNETGSGLPDLFPEAVDGVPADLPTYTLAELDQVRKSMGDAITVAERGNAGATAQNLRTARNVLDDVIDKADLSGLSTDVRSAYAKTRSLQKAVELGQDGFIHMKPKDFKQAVAKMSKADIDGLSVGIVQGLIEKMEKMQADGKAFTNFLKTDEMKLKLSQTFSKKQIADIEKAVHQREVFKKTGDVAASTMSTLPSSREVARYADKTADISPAITAAQQGHHASSLFSKIMRKVPKQQKLSAQTLGLLASPANAKSISTLIPESTLKAKINKGLLAGYGAAQASRIRENR